MASLILITHRKSTHHIIVFLAFSGIPIQLHLLKKLWTHVAHDVRCCRRTMEHG